MLKFVLVTQHGMSVSAIYFGDIDAFLTYLEEKYGKRDVEAAMGGYENKIELSLVYFPKINIFRNVEELQFEIQYYQ